MANYLEDGDVMTDPSYEEEMRRRLALAPLSPDDPENENGPPFSAAGAPVTGDIPPPPDPETPVPFLQRGLDRIEQQPLPTIDGPPLPRGLDPHYENAVDEVERVYGNMPKPPEPKWWQRGLGAVAGGLAGWSNAASRTKHPIDIAALEENIQRPGYKQKLGDWQQNLAKAEAVAKTESTRADEGRKVRAQQADEAYKQAEAERARAQGDWYRARQQPEWYQNAKGQMINRVTGEMKGGPQSVGDRIKELMGAGYSFEDARVIAVNPTQYGKPEKAEKPERILTPVQILTEEAAHPGTHSKPEVDKAQALFNQEHRGPRDPNADRPMTRAQKIAIESKHQQAYETLAKQVMTERAKGTDEGAITNYENQQKQIIENAYAAELSAATSNYIPPYNYSAALPQGKPAGGGRGGGGDKVVVISKAGVSGQIPRARLQDYLANGYKLQ